MQPAWDAGDGDDDPIGVAYQDDGERHRGIAAQGGEESRFN